MRLRRSRPFAELVERQLDLFAVDHAGLVADCEAALRAYDTAETDTAEAAFGEYLDHVDTLREELEGARDAYTATLDDEAAQAYGAAFAAEARRRFPQYVLELD
jgi:hypothetical protein